MVRENRTHIAENKFLAARTARKHLTREEFGRRVYRAMMEKGWTQAEFARQSKILPDSISNYVRGNIMPTPQNLKKLAEALDVEETYLLPNHYEQAIDAEVEPAFDMKSSTADPAKAWLRVNQLVSFATAVKIADLLKDDAENADEADGSSN